MIEKVLVCDALSWFHFPRPSYVFLTISVINSINIIGPNFQLFGTLPIHDIFILLGHVVRMPIYSNNVAIKVRSVLGEFIIFPTDHFSIGVTWWDFILNWKCRV